MDIDLRCRFDYPWCRCGVVGRGRGHRADVVSVLCRGWLEREARYGLQPGHHWFLISMQWWQQWMDYVKYVSTVRPALREPPCQWYRENTAPPPVSGIGEHTPPVSGIGYRRSAVSEMLIPPSLAPTIILHSKSLRSHFFPIWSEKQLNPLTTSVFIHLVSAK